MKFLITGASSDIACAIVEALRRRIASGVLLVSRSPGGEPCRIESNGFVTLQGLDLTSAAHLRFLRIESETFFDEPFITIHCAGDYWKHRPLDETDMEVASRMIASHYLTLYGVVHAVVPLMRRLGGGRFIAFSCNSVSHNYPEMAAFTSAKAAVECLVKCVANEYSGDGVQANALALPTIRTQKVISDESKPLGNPDNYLAPEEVARIVVDEVATLSPGVNGSVMNLWRYSRDFYHKAFFDRNPSGRSTKR